MKKLKHNDTAGVATYVLIMFGVIFILYLFGYTNSWIAYADDSGAGTNDANIIDMIVSALSDNLTIIGGGLTALFGAAFISRWIFGAQTAATILTYAFPVVLLIALNIFIFPINEISGDVAFMGPLTVFLFALLNYYLLYFTNIQKREKEHPYHQQ